MLFDTVAYSKSIESSRRNSPFYKNYYDKKDKLKENNLYGTDSIYGTRNSSFNSMMQRQLQQMHSGNNPAILYGPGIIGSASGNRIVDMAAAEIGIGTDANSAERYGEAGPWCAAFANTMYKKATGSDSPIGNSHYVPTLVDNAKSKGLFAQAGDPNGARPGNFVFFGEDYHHVGLVESVDPDGTVHTIEGNSSDQVRRKSYSPDSGRISGYAMVAA